jgi:prepilin-type processing-associated H-X9-DG protein
LTTIGKAMRQYAGANGGHFPDKLESIVANGTLKAEVLICPATGDTPAPGATPNAQAESLRGGRHVSYTYVGQNLSTWSPAECVLMYETPNRHGDGMYVLFVDGRVQTIGSVEASKAITRLSRGVNPPWTTSGK